MAAAAYISQVEDLELPDLLLLVEDVEDAVGTVGWKIVQRSIDAHRERLTARLVHTSTKPEAIDYLRGQIEALGAMREAADGIIALAKERERAAIKEHA